MGSIKILDASGHTTMTPENSTTDDRRAAWDRAVKQEHKVPFDTTTKERITGSFDDTKDVLLVPPIQGG